MTTYEQIVAVLREFGFPVLVAVWFMWRLEKRLDRLIELMSALLQAIALLAKAFDYRNAQRDTGVHPALPEETDS